jgi:Zn finger protein HypA/HybF involved in hydrogenase expression
MAETSASLRRILERIRDDTQQALKLLGDAAEVRSLGWKCTACGNVKHFTRPVTNDVASPCPKCRGNAFQALQKRATN